MRCIVLVALLMNGHLSWAAANDSPARLQEGEHSIEARIRVPKNLKVGRYSVHCESIILSNGRSRDFVCYSMDSSAPQNLIDAVELAGRNARFTPALRNGRPTDVHMVLMARVDIYDECEPLIIVVPNNGADAQRYGLLYSAPQRLNEFKWSHSPLHRSHASFPVLVWLVLRIDEQGSIMEHTLRNDSNEPPAVLNRLEEAIERMKFIPGYFNGEPKAMLYLEPAFSRMPRY